MGEEREEGRGIGERLHNEEREYDRPILMRVGQTEFMVVPKKGMNILEKGRVYLYEAGELRHKATIMERATIGRAGGNDIRVYHEEVSRQHGFIEVRKGGRFLLGDHSRNGTDVDPIKEMRKGRYPLKPGERQGPYLLGQEPVNIILGGRVKLILGKDEKGAFLQDAITGERRQLGSEREEESVVRIGRGPENDFTSAAKPVSRRHAELTYLHGVYYVRDLGSSKGTELWKP